MRRNSCCQTASDTGGFGIYGSSTGRRGERGMEKKAFAYFESTEDNAIRLEMERRFEQSDYIHTPQLSEDASFWCNEVVANFYHKEMIRMIYTE